MPFIRSISGVRATTADAFPPEVIATYVTAFAQMPFITAGPIVVGRDGRTGGEQIEQIVCDALLRAGRDVVNIGVAPTPTVQLCTEHSDAGGGIAITASHNPQQWNGLKFLGPDGVFLDAEQVATFFALVDESAPLTAHGVLDPGLRRDDEEKHREPQTVYRKPQTVYRDHISRVLALDAVRRAPRANGERVVVDAVNASGSVIVPQLLRELGYEVIELYCDGSGVFPHTPEPLAENLTALGEAVRAHNAAFGVAVDPDADRLVLYDHHGEPIGEEKTVTLAAQAVLATAPAGQHVVVNYSTTRMVDDVATAAGATTHRAPVGEINVVRRMQHVGAIIGGEGSGGVIMPACHAGRDSLVGIGVITSYLRERRITLADASAALPRYVMLKTKHELTDRAALSTALPRIAEAFGGTAIVSTEDGVHAAFPDRWVHVRGSNTEPILRIIAEAPTLDDAEVLVNTVGSLLRR